MLIEPRAERKRLWGLSDKGPDFKIVAPHTLWLEAITPGAGTTEDCPCRAWLRFSPSINGREFRRAIELALPTPGPDFQAIFRVVSFYQDISGPRAAQ